MLIPRNPAQFQIKFPSAFFILGRLVIQTENELRHFYLSYFSHFLLRQIKTFLARKKSLFLSLQSKHRTEDGGKKYKLWNDGTYKTL